jgi:hypothetical protein
MGQPKFTVSRVAIGITWRWEGLSCEEGAGVAATGDSVRPRAATAPQTKRHKTIPTARSERSGRQQSGPHSANRPPARPSRSAQPEDSTEGASCSTQKGPASTPGLYCFSYRWDCTAYGNRHPRLSVSPEPRDRSISPPQARQLASAVGIISGDKRTAVFVSSGVGYRSESVTVTAGGVLGCCSAYVWPYRLVSVWLLRTSKLDDWLVGMREIQPLQPLQIT